MTIDKIIADIDAQIATRTSGDFGIKVGNALFSALIKAGKIKKAKFGVMGTGLFECEFPAYDGKYVVTPDWEFPDDAFAVGTPRA